MKEVLRRAIIVGWIASICVLFFTNGVNGGEVGNSCFAAGLIAVPTWVVQYVLLGIINPARLFNNPISQ
jgi:hypothetical protein